MAGPIKPYLIVGRVKNNRLWQSIKQLYPSVETQRAAADLLGVSSQSLADLLNMKKTPFHRNTNTWSVVAKRVAFSLKADPLWLFEDNLYNMVESPKFSFSAGMAEWATFAKMNGWPLKNFARSLKQVAGSKVIR